MTALLVKDGDIVRLHVGDRDSITDLQHTIDKFQFPEVVQVIEYDVFCSFFSNV